MNNNLKKDLLIFKGSFISTLQTQAAGDHESEALAHTHVHACTHKTRKHMHKRHTHIIYICVREYLNMCSVGVSGGEKQFKMFDSGKMIEIHHCIIVLTRRLGWADTHIYIYIYIFTVYPFISPIRLFSSRWEYFPFQGAAE